ncbi:MAG: hypothetical protein GKR93_14425 [Gammaproteobacteria bacterium]|nr:hypothetical protein [Gammaproteobacteria bacterium]
MTISDTELITRFEDLSLPPSKINHISHLRIAWLYLRHLPLSKAIEKITLGTKCFAEYHGDYEKYHHTVSEACARIMKQRISEQGEKDFENFLVDNMDLVEDLKSLLQEYYSERLLWSKQAKSQFMKPDKQQLN